MIDLSTYDYDPKFTASEAWKSEKYRRWIRDIANCLACGQPLSNEKENFVSHHHRHLGGKRPHDNYLVPLCLACHNAFHADEVGFRRRHGLTTESFDRWAVVTLTGWIFKHGKQNLLLNVLGEIGRSLENE